jgi:hypothetical protein
MLPLPLLLLAATDWVVLAPGVEWRSDDGLQIVRVGAPATIDVASGERRTAAEWARQTHAVAVTNASMFLGDLRTSAGHLHCGGLTNQPAWSGDYQSVLAFRPLVPGLPPFTVIDRDQSGAAQTLSRYGCAVQNLRLIRAPGEGVWRAPPRRWAESALALDRSGRLLLVFSKKPVSMETLIDRLLTSDLQIVRAMHLDGGPEASLSVHAGMTQLDLTAGREPVALPNVLVVR